ncbi:DUF4235 domain-containing protein [Trueperella sp. LYQ143]|uniref:DUF4235 domain-containing protein n=1 Tax=unclassified Trueperella TaxID=2630174 RepID=UPI0039834B8F
MNIGWKVVSLAISGAAGVVANQVVGQIWEKGLHKQRPEGDEAEIDLPLIEIVVFTGVTAVVNTLITTALKRKAAQWYGNR